MKTTSSAPKPCERRLQLTDDQIRLATEYFPLARALARPLRVLWPSAEDDLESAAMLALVEAARAFDPKRGVRFATYARHRILGALRDAQRELVPRGWRDRDLDSDELPRLVSLTEHLELLGRPVACETVGPPVGTELEQIDSFEKWVSRLPKRHAQACREIYLHDRTQAEAAARMGCSQSRLSSLHREAIEILNGTWSDDPTPRHSRTTRRDPAHVGGRSGPHTRIRSGRSGRKPSDS